jgi:hypothetical protein
MEEEDTIIDTCLSCLRGEEELYKRSTARSSPPLVPFNTIDAYVTSESVVSL